MSDELTPDEKIAARKARLKLLGKGEALAGENGDRLFAHNGNSYRVRVIAIDEIPPNAPVNGSPYVAPAIVGLSVSVALMEGSEVAKDSAGRLVIFPATSLTIQPEALEREDFDLEAEILIVVAAQIDSAHAQLAGRAQMPGQLDKWGARRFIEEGTI